MVSVVTVSLMIAASFCEDLCDFDLFPRSPRG